MGDQVEVYLRMNPESVDVKIGNRRSQPKTIPHALLDHTHRAETKGMGAHHHIRLHLLQPFLEPPRQQLAQRSAETVADLPFPAVGGPPEGGCVLKRVQIDRSGQLLQWSAHSMHSTTDLRMEIGFHLGQPLIKRPGGLVMSVASDCLRQNEHLIHIHHRPVCGIVHRYRTRFRTAPSGSRVVFRSSHYSACRYRWKNFSFEIYTRFGTS